jgi:hypothetical protein
MTDKQTHSEDDKTKAADHKDPAKSPDKKSRAGNWLTDKLKKKKPVKDEDPNIYPLF